MPARKKAEPKKIGRPTKFTEQLAQEVCDRIANGEPLAVICRDAHMPCETTVRSWGKGSAVLSEAIAHARETGFDLIAWRARQTLRGKGPADGGESTGDVQRDKAIADFDLKLLSKWDPKRYGDKLAHVGGDPEDGDKPIQTALTIRFVDVEPGA